LAAFRKIDQEADSVQHVKDVLSGIMRHRCVAGCH
jgi:hypothetical protein